MRTNDRVADRLLEEDRRRRAAMTRGSASTIPVDDLLDTLIEHELQRERVVQRVAVLAWCALVVFVLLTGLAYYLSRIDVETVAEAAGPAMFVCMALAGLAFFLALLMTLTWLFRSRAAPIAIVEERLSRLESALRGDATDSSSPS